MPEHFISLLFRNQQVSYCLLKKLLGPGQHGALYASIKEQQGNAYATHPLCHLVEHLVKQDKHEDVDFILRGLDYESIDLIVLAFKVKSLAMAEVIYKHFRGDEAEEELSLEHLDMIKALLIRVRHEKLGMLFMRSLRRFAEQERESGRHSTRTPCNVTYDTTSFRRRGGPELHIQHDRPYKFSHCHNWTTTFQMYISLYVKNLPPEGCILELVEDPSQEYVDCYRELRPSRYPFGLR